VPVLGEADADAEGDEDEHTMRRTLLLLESAMKVVAPMRTMPLGLLKEAELLMPSVPGNDAMPVPARVPTEPSRLTVRSELLLLSATSRLLEAASKEIW